MQSEPYSEELPEEETLQLASEERASFLSEAAARQAACRPCPVCGLHNPAAQLVCLRCQSDLVAREITLHLGPSQSPPGAKIRAVGEVLVRNDTPITFEIGSTALRLPVAAIVTIGRQATVRDARTPHVDLTPYDAWEHGISRNHVEIRRKIMLLYIVDLGSTNGSLLNGRRLHPFAEHLLRSGDRLQLSRLNITVKF